MQLVARIDRFCLALAIAVDNLTVGICRAAGQPIPVGVLRRRRKWESR